MRHLRSLIPLTVVFICPLVAGASEFGHYCRNVQVTDREDLVFKNIQFSFTTQPKDLALPRNRNELDQWDQKLSILDLSPRLERSRRKDYTYVTGLDWNYAIPPSVTTRALTLGNLLQVQLLRRNEEEFFNTQIGTWAELFSYYKDILNKDAKSLLLDYRDGSAEIREQRWNQISALPTFYQVNSKKLFLEKLASAPICEWVLEDIFGKAPSCSESLRRLMEIGPAEDSWDVTDPQLIVRLTKKRAIYEEVMLGATSTFLSNSIDALNKRTANPHFFGYAQKLSLFEVLKTKFLEKGYAERDAIEASIDILALYGMRGMNLSILEFGSAPHLLILIRSLQVSLALSHFWDAILMESEAGYLSTAPNAIRGDCDDGKLYHFWMAAYFVKTLINKGEAPADAIHATFAAQSAYQFMPDVTPSSRNTRVPLLVKWNSISADRYRMDSTYGILGARFGAGLASSSAASVFVRSKNDSDRLTPMNNEEAAELANWQSGWIFLRVRPLLKWVQKQYSLKSFIQYSSP